MPGVGPEPLIPAAVFAVTSLKAVSFKLPPFAEGPRRPAKGRPEEKAMTVLHFQSFSNLRPANEVVRFSKCGS